MNRTVTTVRIADRDLEVPLPEGLRPVASGPDGPALLALGAGEPPVAVATAVVTRPVGLDRSLDALHRELVDPALIDVDRTVPTALVTLLHGGIGTDVVTVQRLLEDVDVAVTVTYSWPAATAGDHLTMLSGLAREVAW